MRRTSRQRKPKRLTIGNRLSSPWRRDSNQTAAGIPRAVHLLLVCYAEDQRLFSFFSKRKPGLRRHVTYALRWSINQVDYPLCVEETTTENAFARGAIYSGAALVKDALRSLPKGMAPFYMGGNDPEPAYAPIQQAHRIAIVGLATFARDVTDSFESSLDQIFERAPLNGDELTFLKTLMREVDQESGAAIWNFCNEIGIRFAAPDPRFVINELLSQISVRHLQLLQLSKSKENRPYLEFLRSEIL